MNKPPLGGFISTLAGEIGKMHCVCQLKSEPFDDRKVCHTGGING
jgi:hypothetical protein